MNNPFSDPAFARALLGALLLLLPAIVIILNSGPPPDLNDEPEEPLTEDERYALEQWRRLPLWDKLFGCDPEKLRRPDNRKEQTR
jgi:hypothetical protein